MFVYVASVPPLPVSLENRLIASSNTLTFSFLKLTVNSRAISDCPLRPDLVEKEATFEKEKSQDHLCTSTSAVDIMKMDFYLFVLACRNISSSADDKTNVCRSSLHASNKVSYTANSVGDFNSCKRTRNRREVRPSALLSPSRLEQYMPPGMVGHPHHVCTLEKTESSKSSMVKNMGV